MNPRRDKQVLLVVLLIFAFIWIRVLWHEEASTLFSTTLPTHVRRKQLLIHLELLYVSLVSLHLDLFAFFTQRRPRPLLRVWIGDLIIDSLRVLVQLGRGCTRNTTFLQRCVSFDLLVRACCIILAGFSILMQCLHNNQLLICLRLDGDRLGAHTVGLFVITDVLCGLATILFRALQVLYFLGLNDRIFVLISLVLENFFPFSDVTGGNVVCYRETIEGCTTQGIANIIHAHLVLMARLGFDCAEEVYEIGVGVGLEMSEEHHVII